MECLNSMNKSVKILAIETSCDDTAVACFLDNIEISSVVHSQLEEHNKFGGVVPEIASRNHIMALPTVLNKALIEARYLLQEIDYIACTYGAGLQGALLAGVSYSKALSYALNIPLLPINHIQAHIAANFVTTAPPFLCLVVSGGHTSLVWVESYTKFETLNSTTDDAMGECFDKVARVLELGYPGGPIIEQYAQKGTPHIEFFKHAKTQNMGLSFSGLKTATINYIKKLDKESLTAQMYDICASFSKTAIDIVVSNTFKEISKRSVDKIVLAGGVSANKQLQQEITKQSRKNNISVSVPPLKYCTDNATMVALCAYYQYILPKRIPLPKQYLDLNVNSGLELSQSLL